MKSVLLITNYKPNTGGIAAQVELLQECFQKEKRKYKVFNTRKNILLRVVLLIRLLFVAQKFDVLHIHGCSWIGGFYPILIGTITGKLLRKKIIITYHGGQAKLFIQKYRVFASFFLGLADVVTVPSIFLFKIFNSFSIKSIIIPNMFAVRKDLYVERQFVKPVFITTRTLSKIYNIPCAIRAFGIIQNRYPEAKLFILSDGPEMENLKKLVDKLLLQNVTFLGRVGSDEVMQYLQKADVLMNPTSEDNMPISVLEAFQAGLPVVSTNVGGLPYIIDDNETGLLVENNDHMNMANKCICLLNDNILCNKISKNAYKKITQFSVDNVYKKFSGIYDE